MFILDVGVFRRNFIEDLMEESISHLHDVVFGKASDLLAVIAAGILERITYDLFRTRSGDQFQTLNDLFSLSVLDAGVKVLLILTHDHDIHVGMFRLDKGVIGDARANICIETKSFSHCNVETLEATALRCSDWRFQKHL